MKSLLILTIFSSVLIEINGLKVLGIFPFGTKSHFQVGHEIIKSLIDVGHEATVVSPYPLKTSIKNYKDVSIVEILDIFKKGKLIRESNPKLKESIIYVFVRILTLN